MRPIGRVFAIACLDSRQQWAKPRGLGCRFEFDEGRAVVEVKRLEVAAHRTGDDANAGARVFCVPCEHRALAGRSGLVLLPRALGRLGPVLLWRYDADARAARCERRLLVCVSHC